MLGLKLIKVLLAGGSAESWNSQKTELSSLGALTKNRYVELGRNLLCSYWANEKVVEKCLFFDRKTKSFITYLTDIIY